MIGTFEDLFAKMKADGKKRTMLLFAYERMKECNTQSKVKAITRRELFDLRGEMSCKSIWIDGYLKCLCEGRYISSAEYAKLHKTLLDLEFK